MSTDATTAPVTAPAAPVTAADPAENVALRNALEAVRADYAKLAGETQLVAKAASESQAALGAALRERDTFKAQLAELAPKAKLADELQVKVEGYVNAGRESALVDALRSKLPGAEPLAIRGVLAQLAEQGKASRYPEDAAAEAAKVLEVISIEAPSLTRPPTLGGGSPGARQAPAQPQRTKHPLG